MEPRTNITLPRGYILSGKLMLAAIIVLFSIVLLLLFLHLFLRFLRRRRRNSLTLTASFDRTPAPRALDPAVLSSLPISLFSAADLDADDVGECAVCLSEFAEGDKVRVLPRCDHRFHVACVDVWFGSNSSCPLCRSPVEVGSPASEEEEEETASPGEQCGDLEVGSSSSGEIGRREEELGLGLGFGFAWVLVMKKLRFGNLRREGDLERGEAA